MNQKMFLMIMFCFFAISLSYAINISGGITLTEDFTIGTTATATLSPDWKVDKNTTVRTVGTYTSAVTATERSGGNAMGTTAANGIYNYGAGDAATATDRSVGWISSGNATKSGNLYVQLVNNGNTAIGNFTISFDVEKYRKGTNAGGFSIQMYYSADGATWTSAGSDFLVSFPGVDADNAGYTTAPGATTSISLMSLPQALVASDTLYLAWNYSVTSGAVTSYAQALGIDNVVITANSSGPSLPSLSTTAISEITPTTASSGGNIVFDGGSGISARGVCWNTGGAPIITDSHTSDGTGASSFVSTITGLTASTAYHVRAYATNSTGTAYGNELTFTTGGNGPPPAPVAVTATSITYNSFIANWNNVAEATSYRLDVSTTESFTSFIAGFEDVSVNALAHAVNGLTFSTTYYYRVRAVNADGASPNSNTISVLTDVSPEIPNAPVALAASGVSSSGFIAGWNASTNATSYHLDVSSSDTFSSFVTGYEDLVVNGLTQSVSGLSATSTYYYRVRASNISGTSTNSNIITVFTNEAGTIILTEGFEDASTGTPPVGWTLSAPGSYILSNGANSHGGTNYAGVNAMNGWVMTPLLVNPTELFFWGRTSGTTSNFTITLQSSPDLSSWTDVTTYIANGTDTGTVNSTYSQKNAGLNLTGSYYLRWMMTARTGGSFYFDDVEVTSGSVIPTIPTAPVALAATSIVAVGFTANWHASISATSYRLDVSTSNAFDSFVLGYEDLIVEDITQSVSGLNAATNYYYRVRAVNHVGTSTNSNVITVLTANTSVIPEAPIAETASGITSAGFIANWNVSTNATSYFLDVSLTNAFTTFVTGYQNLTVNDTLKLVTGLSSLTNYYYRVRADNIAGTSVNSNIIEVMTTDFDPNFTYYNPVAGLTGNALKTGLTNLISTNTYSSYNGAKVIMFQQLDNTNGVVRCVYTGRDFPIASDYSGQNSPNTEHTYAQSWFTASASVEKADLHHLFVTESTVNSTRGNLPFGKAITTTTTFPSFNGYVSKKGTDYNGQIVFEPADQHKGDLARALLYFNVRYEESLFIQNVDQLPACIQWNYLDPPSPAEIARNNQIYSVLSNKNPFVDHPEYVTSIYVPTATNTMLNFAPVSSSVQENVGIVHLSIQIQNSNTYASTAMVVLKSGNAAHLGNFTPVNVTFPASSTTAVSVDVSVTDDDISDGNENFVFEIQNAQGGYYAIPGLQNDYTLTVEDNDGGIPVPVALPAIQVSNTSFIAHWLPVNGINSYSLDVATDADFSSFVGNLHNFVLGDTTYTVSNLEQGHSYYYRVRSVMNDAQSTNSNLIMIILTGNQDPTVSVPITGIRSIYPNPFNPETTIQYSLAKSGLINIEIYNVKGQKVITLVSQNQSAGNYSQVWNGKNDQGKSLSSGIYYVRMKSANDSSVRKVVLMK